MFNDWRTVVICSIGAVWCDTDDFFMLLKYHRDEQRDEGKIKSRKNLSYLLTIQRPFRSGDLSQYIL